MHEDNCAVYVHVNLINGKKYFGITTQNPPENRWKNGNGYYNNAHFMSAVKKYGWDNFAHYVLFKNIPVAIAKNIEELLIREHMSYDPRFGYNRTYGGELEIPNNEARRKISEAMMGDNNPAKRPEVRRKMSEAMPKRAVEAIDVESGQRVLYFKSTQDAGRAGFDRRAVAKCCNGKRRSHCGLAWRFVEEVNNNDSDN